jgi:hypothetical protein
MFEYFELSVNSVIGTIRITDKDKTLFKFSLITVSSDVSQLHSTSQKSHLDFDSNSVGYILV